MYGLHNGYHHFNSFDGVQSLPLLLGKAGIRTGIIGKKHVAPEYVYPFDFAQTEENHKIMQVGRNITLMKDYAEEFLKNQAKNQSFLLYIGFHDPHRCGHTNPQFGNFCEKFGNGESGMGVIPDWTPLYYNASEVVVPSFVQDTPAAREDISAQYTTISRLDQGVGLMMTALEKYGFLDNTLVILTSDNGIPFPNGRTNLYHSGTIEPFILSSPLDTQNWGKKSDVFVSLLDITPTILDWLGVSYPTYQLFDRDVKLMGKSLLTDSNSDVAYGSHSLHEITMFYPMRSVHKGYWTYIENLNFKMPFPIDQDFYLAPSFQDLLNRTSRGEALNWFKSLQQYYYRLEFELFNRATDPLESKNLAHDPAYENIKTELQILLHKWRKETWDPWICYPWGVLEDAGAFKENPVCMGLLNGLKHGCPTSVPGSICGPR